MTIILQQIKVGRSQVWVEVEQEAVAQSSAKRAVAGKGGKTAKTSAQSAAGTALAAVSQADLASTLSAIVAPVHEALKAMAPDEVQVELSLGIRGEVGVFVAKGEGNASLKVTARWKFDRPTAKS